MKNILRKLFFPILQYFESGTEPYGYKTSSRWILIVMGLLFSGLATLVLFLGQGQSSGYLFPVIIFGSLGLLSIIIGSLGKDRAVAKVWGSR